MGFELLSILTWATTDRICTDCCPSICIPENPFDDLTGRAYLDILWCKWLGSRNLLWLACDVDPLLGSYPVELTPCCLLRNFANCLASAPSRTYIRQDIIERYGWSSQVRTHKVKLIQYYLKFQLTWTLALLRYIPLSLTLHLEPIQTYRDTQ